MENKFTDNEIMKALEYCCKITNCEEKCDRKNDCILLHMHEIIDLISRKNEEIENLNIELQAMRGAANSYKMHYDNAQAELGRLQKENSILSHNADTAFQDGLNEAQELYQEQIKSEIKRQAISDFVEAFEGRCISGGIYPAFIKNQLYAVKGDMTEGDKL